MRTLKCDTCGIVKKVRTNKGGKRFCSIVCRNKGFLPWNKGKKCPEISVMLTGKHPSEETRRKQSESRKRFFANGGIHPRGLLGKKLTEEHKRKIKLSVGKGENHHRWIKDRTKLAKRQERNDMAYKEWRRQVMVRDKYECRVSSEDCEGKIIAHHIFIWSKYPELRYKVTNGITLCHAHHPKRRAEENRLAPLFVQLVQNQMN